LSRSPQFEQDRLEVSDQLTQRSSPAGVPARPWWLVPRHSKLAPRAGRGSTARSALRREAAAPPGTRLGSENTTTSSRPSGERACGETASRSRETEGSSSVGSRSLDGLLDLVSAQWQKCSKAGAAAILSPPLAFGQSQGPNAGPRLTEIIVCARLSRFPRRCDVARTFWGSGWRRDAIGKEGLNLFK
jgi:hypothetical protein